MSNTENRTDDKECSCSYCNDSSIVYLYNKDGDSTNMPCPKCTDEMSHIRGWDGHGYYKRLEGS